MGSRLSDDEQPPSHNDDHSGHGQQPPCIIAPTNMALYHVLISDLQDARTHLSSIDLLPLDSDLQLHRINQQQESHRTHDAEPYAPVVADPYHLPQNQQQVWPSPPPESDNHNNHSVHSSPGNSSVQLSCYNPSPISPTTWSSPDFPLAQSGSLQSSHQILFQDLRMYIPTPNKGHVACGTRVLMPFENGIMSQGFDSDLGSLYRSYCPTTFLSSSTKPLSCTSFPQETLFGTPVYVKTERQLPTGDVEPCVSPEVKGETQELDGAESYAELLHRALMTAPGHAMTLQEIYQWFRDNTDKDIKANKTGRRTDKSSRGWQNSVRHNLSMNKAFVKREHKHSSNLAPNNADQGSNRTAEPKKPREWMLQHWAVKGGVMSTTKYRHKYQPLRQAMGSSMHHHPYDHRLQHENPTSVKGYHCRKTDSSTNKLSKRGRHHTHEANMPPTSHMVHPHTIGNMIVPRCYQVESHSRHGYE